jgi:hypothetical protein
MSNKTNKTVGKTTVRKESAQMFNKEYKLDYKEYSQAKQVAFRIMQIHNNRLYKDTTISFRDKKFLKYDETLKMLLSKSREDILAVIAKHTQEMEIEQEAKIYTREQELTKYQEQVDAYFNKVAEAKQKKLVEFINKIKGTPEEKQEALAWFRSLTYDQQQTVINKVDNYFYQQEHEEIEIPTSYLENLKKGDE